MACLLVVPAALSQKPQQTLPALDDVPKLEQSDDINARIAELAVAATAQQEDYVIGIGDLLGIEVFDVAELSRDARVNETGFLSLPLVPVRIHAAGLTAFQLQDKLAELLQTNGLVSNPQVSVTVKERHSEPITITGAVKAPTLIQPVGRITLLGALSQAGGVSSDASEKIVITRPAHVTDPDFPSPNDAQPTTITVSLDQVLDSNDPTKYNIPLLGGDVVNVTRAGIVYAVGAVLHNGGFILANDHEQMSVLKLLAISGGLTPTAKSHHAIILRRNHDTGQRLEVPVDVRKILTLKANDVTMMQNDILFVPDSITNRALRQSGSIAVSLATGAALYRLY